MKKIFSMFLFFVMMISIVAVDYKTRYEHLLKTGRLDELEKHLTSWEEAEPNNPEVCIAFFNFYKKKGKSSKISLDSYKKETTSGLVLFDKKQDSVVAYVNENEKYEEEYVENALESIEKGIELAPNRLDMYFYRIDFLGQIENYNAQADRIIELIKQSENSWLWKNNKELSTSSSKKLIFSKLDKYYKMWLREKKQKSLDAAKRCGETQIEMYPDDILGYNTLGTVLVISRRYEEALAYCLQAAKIDEKDDTAIFNIATCYERINNKTNAIEYYEKLAESQDERLKEYAKKKLKALK